MQGDPAALAERLAVCPAVRHGVLRRLLRHLRHLLLGCGGRHLRQAQRRGGGRRQLEGGQHFTMLLDCSAPALLFHIKTGCRMCADGESLSCSWQRTPLLTRWASALPPAAERAGLGGGHPFLCAGRPLLPHRLPGQPLQVSEGGCLGWVKERLETWSPQAALSPWPIALSIASWKRSCPCPPLAPVLLCCRYWRCRGDTVAPYQEQAALLDRTCKVVGLWLACSAAPAPCVGHCSSYAASFMLTI